jgi:NAD(P)-dependent dehydrogenase (short-subunit alcohol dehydrogenase family)
MTTEQHPINSRFDSESTVDDVLAGIDLTGKLAIVTGGYSGIGLEHTRGLCAAGATVIVPARRPDEAKKQLEGIERVEVESLDLGDLDSVAAFADRFLASRRGVDILLNGAGVMAPAEETHVGPGWELQFAVNHLGHFALTNRLWPALVADGGARVVGVSSRGHKFCDIQWDNIDWDRDYDKWKAYGQSKTAVCLFSLELEELGAGSGVHAFSVSPGGIRTPLQRNMTRAEEVQLGWVDEDGNDLINWKTTEQGAATSVWGATSPLLEGRGGVYLENCEIAEVVDPDAPDAMKAGLHPYAADPDAAARLWEISARMSGVDAFGSTGR